MKAPAAAGAGLGALRDEQTCDYASRADGLPIDGLPEDFTSDMVPVWWNGHTYGEQTGYVRGWRWGFVCGVAVGALLVAISVTVGYGLSR